MCFQLHYPATLLHFKSSIAQNQATQSPNSSCASQQQPTNSYRICLGKLWNYYYYYDQHDIAYTDTAHTLEFFRRSLGLKMSNGSYGESCWSEWWAHRWHMTQKRQKAFHIFSFIRSAPTWWDDNSSNMSFYFVEECRGTETRTRALCRTYFLWAEQNGQKGVGKRFSRLLLGVGLCC